MKSAKAFLVLATLAAVFFSGCNTDPRYEAAALLDNQTAELAQKMTANIEDTDIVVQATKVDAVVFGGSYAEINAAENWVKPYFTFISDDRFWLGTGLREINGSILVKMKSKDIIDADFNITDNETQGLCADVQDVIYTATLDLLTADEKEKYLTTGKQLSFIRDDRPGDNPVSLGSTWLSVDPVTMITNEGDQYYYEPMGLYVAVDDPIFDEGGDERYIGVQYCKFLSHQAILSWMLTKSFQKEPVLLTEKPIECTEPGSTRTKAGSCLFQFPLAFGSYYCSDYTGDYFTPENAEEKCSERPDMNSGASADPVYSPLPCSERTDEIEAYIPDYQGLTAYCAVHCGDTDEFIWNVYTENPEDSCIGYEIFYPED